jgi:hypothetical protein
MRGIFRIFARARGLWPSRGRVVLVFLTIWALAMVVPEFYRLAKPLGAFGFDANGDGLVTDAQGPFPSEAASPARRAGLRRGDRLDLSAMRCIPVDTPLCATALAVLGQQDLVVDQRRGELVLAATSERPARHIALVAEAPPFNAWAVAFLPLDQIAAIAVILAAAWLVWTRPGGMTWGFFLYVIWFNPGQSYQYYALLQMAPAALLLQHFAGAVAQGAGYAGFLLFALRAPQDENSPRWRPFERVLPAVALLLALLLASAYANVFGAPTEFFVRAGVLSGFAVAFGAFVLLLMRRREQPPPDYQRLRWMIWGCLIGLPSLTVADLGQQTTLFTEIWGIAAPPDELWDAVRLVNGVLCLFVFEATRRPLVVSVAIPLRRVTILGLLLSAPALFAHHQFEHVSEGIRESVTLPGWAWVVIGTFGLFIISRLHELAVHHADRYFHRTVARKARALGESILQAPDFAAIEAELADGVCKALGLVSAGVFRKDDDIFRRSACAGAWGQQGPNTIPVKTPAPDDRARETLHARPSDVWAGVADRKAFPEGPAGPVLAVPVGNRFDLYAIAFYGAHSVGNNLNTDERATLADLGELAGDVWAKIDKETLRRRVEALERERNAKNANLTAERGCSGPPAGAAEA